MIDFLTLEMNFTKNIMVKANNIKKIIIHYKTYIN